jgi:F0F1-type ATP synthase membrane subunit c/vacuolar-type H+-ATPase subunit K
VHLPQWPRYARAILTALEQPGTSMKTGLLVAAAMLLASCGAEVATTAATSAALKKQEMEAAKQTKDLVDKKLEAATQAMQKHADDQRNAAK